MDACLPEPCGPADPGDHIDVLPESPSTPARPIMLQATSHPDGAMFLVFLPSPDAALDSLVVEYKETRLTIGLQKFTFLALPALYWDERAEPQLPRDSEREQKVDALPPYPSRVIAFAFRGARPSAAPYGIRLTYRWLSSSDPSFQQPFETVAFAGKLVTAAQSLESYVVPA